LQTRPWLGHVRIVLDTNNLISGLLRKDGPSGALLRMWTDGQFLLVTSTYQLAELRRVIGYARLRRRIQPEEVREFTDNIDSKAIVLGELPTLDVSPDPDDNPILASALAGNADLIVSGDKAHMLALESVDNVPVVNARDALQLLRECQKGNS